LSRRVQLVVLCEDEQHETFIRRFLRTMRPSDPIVRVERLRREGGAGQAFVRDRFPTELAEHQRRPVSQALIVMLDGDHRGVAARMTELQDACREAGVRVRFPEDGVLVVVPTWRIETWLAYLDGESVDESNRNYPRLSRSRDCAPHVDTLAAMCRRKTLRQPAPDSLIRACSEYGRWADSA
jgi:hypothetical protein